MPRSKENPLRKRRYDEAMNAALRAQEEIRAGAPEGDYLPWIYETIVSVLNFGQKECSDQDMRNLLEALGWSLMPHLKDRFQAPGVVKRISSFQQQLGIDSARHEMVDRIMTAGVSFSKACGVAAQVLDSSNHPARSGKLDASTIMKSYNKIKDGQAQLPEEFWSLPGMLQMPELPDPTDALKDEGLI